MQHIYTLKSRLLDTLRINRILSYEQVETLARKAGFKPDSATRRLRAEENGIPCVKLNAKKKPIRENERWEWVRWAGGRTVFN